jgi:RNA polymerase sigma-70 factor, ECF subfamily
MAGARVSTVGVNWPEWTITVAHPEGAHPPAPTTVALDALDDRQLVAACLDGHREAFDELVVRHRQSIYKVCYRFVGSHEDATDLAQETFLRGYRALRKFKGDSQFGTWLYRIAVNLCLNKVSAKVPRTQPLDDKQPLPSLEPDAMSRLLSGERAEQVRAAVARLPPRQRATLILRVYQDLPHQDIARVLGSSVGAVKANFFHALHNLRRLLGDGSR